MNVLSILLSTLFIIPSIADSQAVGDEQSELICHGSDRQECYPRVFVPTHEFQVVREDQQIPAGLHIRLDVVTGRKQAKIYDPREDESDSAFEAVEVIPGQGPVDLPLGDQDLPLVDNAASSYGPIRVPTTYAEDAPIFTAAASVLMRDPPPANLTAYMYQLRDLTDDMYWGLELASNEAAVYELSRLIADPQNDAERSALAASILASAGRNNAPAVSAMLAYQSSPSSVGPSSVWDAVLGVLQLDRQTRKATLSSQHISRALQPKAYERYISLLSSLLSGAAEYRTDMIDGMTHLAGPVHFNGKAAGSSAPWDGARKRLLALLVDHYLPSSGGTPVGEGKLKRLSKESASQFCDLLQAWRGACDHAKRGWRDDKDGRELVREIRAIIEDVVQKSWEHGGCAGLMHNESKSDGKNRDRSPMLKEDL